MKKILFELCYWTLIGVSSLFCGFLLGKIFVIEISDHFQKILRDMIQELMLNS